MSTSCCSMCTSAREPHKISVRILGKSSHSHYIVCDDSGLLGIPCEVGSVPAAWLLLMGICDVQAFVRPYWAVHFILKHNPLGLGIRRFGLGNRDGPQMLLKPKLKNYVSCNNSKYIRYQSIQWHMYTVLKEWKQPVSFLRDHSTVGMGNWQPADPFCRPEDIK